MLGYRLSYPHYRPNVFGREYRICYNLFYSANLFITVFAKIPPIRVIFPLRINQGEKPILLFIRYIIELECNIKPPFNIAFRPVECKLFDLRNFAG